ncbi:MAG: Xaa-Pro peptidase family protein [Anaerolineae bacterium]|jgi:Xaa-Pro aminopeptidase
MSDVKITCEKLDQAVDILQEKDVDLWLTFVRETTQVSDPCLELLLGFDLTWASALMLSRQGERLAIVGRFDADNVARVGGYTTVVGYDQSIRGLLREHVTRLNPHQIALNFSNNDPAADGLTHGMFQVLQDLLSGTEYVHRFISAEGIVGALRGRKSPAEISRLQSSVRTAEAIFRRVGPQIRSGLTEREVAAFFHEAASEQKLGLAWGADYCPAITAGPESSVGHAMPGDTIVQRGHLLQADFGVEKDGFVSDLQRTWYLLKEGETAPPAAVLEAWEAARTALEAGRQALRPGARGWEVDRAARDTLTSAGYPEYLHAFGHHIGRTVHDGATVLGPRWERYGNSVEGMVEAGNVFAIELGLSVPGHGYIGREEDVLVTSEGAEYLCEPQAALWCI